MPTQNQRDVSSAHSEKLGKASFKSSDFHPGVHAFSSKIAKNHRRSLEVVKIQQIYIDHNIRLRKYDEIQRQAFELA